MVEFVKESVLEVFQLLFSMLTRPLQTTATALFDFLFKHMNNSFVDAINHPLLNAVATVFSWFSWTLLLVSIPFFLIKIVLEEKRDWMIIIRCFFMALAFVQLNQYIAKLCFYVPYLIVSMFGYLERSPSWEDLFSPDGTIGILLTIVLVIALIAFFIVSMMRVGAIFTQMLVAPFYVPFVLMGDNQKAMEWVLTTVSMGITYIIQYALFYLGMVLLQFADAADIMTLVFGMGMLLSTFSVPAILQKFGFSSGAGRGFQSMSMPVTNIAMTLLRK